MPSPGGSLEVGKGEQLTITLDANPTTGFQWQLATQLDEKVVTLVGHEYHRSDAAGIGTSGSEVWTFKAVGNGSTTIVLERPASEHDMLDAERKTFPVVVH